MPQLRYLTPFAFLALLPLGILMGGAWTFAAALATPLCLTAFDTILGEEPAHSPPRKDSVQRWLPRLYVLLQLAATAGAATSAAQPSTTLLEATGLALSAGVTTGVFGFVAAHELIHSSDRRDRGLGVGFLASVFYMQFRIAHVYGHHRRAATFEDPATARLGEGLYAFLWRSVTGQLREAWTLESQRLRRRRHSPASAGNRMILYVSIEISLILALAISSWRTLLFMAFVAAIAVVLLETFNYVAHYGLTRAIGEDGRVERLAANHSWNSGRWMNNASLFNMGRHSDHHRSMSRSYEMLEALPQSAELPSGYAAALLTALIPPLWHRMMDPRAESVRRLA